MSDIRVFVLTHRRPVFLNNCIKSLLASDLIQADYTIYIINNHTDFTLDPVFQSNQRIKVLHNMTRPDFGTGHAARDWNTALIFGFEKLDKPACPIVCTIQDDSEVYPNWYTELRKVMPSKYDFVSAGFGDQFCAYTPYAVQTIGMWDERFCNTGFQEADYFLRARRILKDRASINDFSHGRLHNPYKLDIMVNLPTGCARGDIHDHGLEVLRTIPFGVFMDKWPAYNPEKWFRYTNDLPFNPDGNLEHLSLYPSFIT
jgi:hypothetical protein